MDTTIQNCYNDILKNAIRLKFKNGHPYSDFSLKLADSGRANKLITAELDRLANTNEFSNLLYSVGLAASKLLGGVNLYNSAQFDMVSLSGEQCIELKTFFDE